MSGNESRLQAIYHITNREDTPTEMPKKLKKIWAADVFNLAKMEELLSKKAFKGMKKTIATGEALDPAIADVVAAAMKMVNTLSQIKDARDPVYAEGVDMLLRLLSPVVPHITHALWQSLGHKNDILTASWPQPDESDQCRFQKK